MTSVLGVFANDGLDVVIDALTMPVFMANPPQKLEMARVSGQATSQWKSWESRNTGNRGEGCPFFSLNVFKAFELVTCGLQNAVHDPARKAARFSC